LAFNFGPLREANRTVAEVVQEALKHLPGKWEDKSYPNAVHEAKLLQLSIDKADALLGWKPAWDFQTAIAKTVCWYREANLRTEVGFIRELTLSQIAAYHSRAKNLGIPWAAGS